MSENITYQPTGGRCMYCGHSTSRYPGDISRISCEDREACSEREKNQFTVHLVKGKPISEEGADEG